MFRGGELHDHSTRVSFRVCSVNLTSKGIEQEWSGLRDILT
jgi:hypothetical protein